MRRNKLAAAKVFASINDQRNPIFPSFHYQQEIEGKIVFCLFVSAQVTFAGNLFGTPMQWNIFNILIFLGCAHGMFFSIFLLSNRKYRKKSNAYLAVFLLGFTFNNLAYLIYDIRMAVNHPLLLYFSVVTWALLIPVAFWWFVRHLLQPSWKPSLLSFGLLVPFCANLLTEAFFVYGHWYQKSLLAPFRSWLDERYMFWEVIAILMSVGFLVAIFRKIGQYQQGLKDNLSNLKPHSIQWLNRMLLGLLGLWLLWSLPYLYELFTGDYNQIHHYPLWIGMSAMVYWIGYSAYVRMEVFEAQDFKPLPSTDLGTLPSKSIQYHQALLELMEKEKPYTNPELGLSSLAEMVGVSAGYLSQIINQKEGERFYDFVNRYRVGEVKRLLADEAFGHYSLLALGMEAGFNSKSTFNTAFKKYTGLTPSQFRRSLPQASRK